MRNKVKPQEGQQWRFKSGSVGYYRAGYIIALKGNYKESGHVTVNFTEESSLNVTEGFLHENFEFVPANYLECLAVSESKWIHRSNFYTEEHWQECRYQLGLDDRPDSFAKALANGLKSAGLGVNQEHPPIFTQAMADAGELPSAGMDCLIKRSHQDDSYFQIGHIIGLSRCKKWLVFSDYLHNLEQHCINNGVYVFKPLAPPIELVDDRPVNLTENKEVVMDLSFEDVGREFLTRDGRIVIGVLFSDVQFVTLDKEGEKYFNIHRLDGVSTEYKELGGLCTCTDIVSRYDPRPWLKDLPDYSIFKGEYLTCDRDGVWVSHSEDPKIVGGCWRKVGSPTYRRCSLDGLRIMPVLEGDQWRLSKIKLSDLAEYQANK